MERKAREKREHDTGVFKKLAAEEREVPYTLFSRLLPICIDTYHPDGITVLSDNPDNPENPADQPAPNSDPSLQDHKDSNNPSSPGSLGKMAEKKWVPKRSRYSYNITSTRLQDSLSLTLNNNPDLQLSSSSEVKEGSEGSEKQVPEWEVVEDENEEKIALGRSITPLVEYLPYMVPVKSQWMTQVNHGHWRHIADDHESLLNLLKLQSEGSENTEGNPVDTALIEQVTERQGRYESFVKAAQKYSKGNLRLVQAQPNTLTKNRKSA